MNSSSQVTNVIRNRCKLCSNLKINAVYLLYDFLKFKVASSNLVCAHTPPLTIYTKCKYSMHTVIHSMQIPFKNIDI